MKKILITGANSYIGTSFEKYIKAFDGYEIDTVDMIDASWREKDFSKYDVVFHVAGIAHIKETEENKHLYYDVNRNLAVETVKKAKNEGVKHFVFLSTMSVFGLSEGTVDKSTALDPVTNYGKAKLQAEDAIKYLSDDGFKISVIRPPMVYGKGCKGNYQLLRKFALITPVFPKVNNKRSMIYIENLCKFVYDIIKNEKTGVFHPQDPEFICTSNMVKYISHFNGKKIWLVPCCSFLKLLPVNTVKKVFGNLIYNFPEDVISDGIKLEQAIKLTEED